MKDVEGVAPRAYIGNYRVFNVPAPAPLGGCCSANSPKIVAAFEAAVRDRMDIINFSGGGPQADPRTDILIEAVANVVRAGVRTDHLGGRRSGLLRSRHCRLAATAPDAISVGTVANEHVFGASLQLRRAPGPAAPGCRSRPPTPVRPPGSWRTNSSSISLSSIAGVSQQLSDAAPTASLRGTIARSSSAAAARTA